MTWMLLAEPRPREIPECHQAFQWPDGKVMPLAPPRQPRQSFCDVVNGRRSQRTFAAMDGTDLSTLLWLSARVIDRQPSALGGDLTLRPAPSAGALHPIHILMCSVRDQQWQRYDPFNHSLVGVPEGLLPVESALQAVESALPVSDGTLIWLAAEPGRTATKYENSDSLVWRDAGALLSQLGLVSSLLGLHFCSLGLTGSDWASPLDQQHLIRGVGLAIAGAPPCHTGC
jgi:SagB-type dehydrogenase family enzyme